MIFKFIVFTSPIMTNFTNTYLRFTASQIKIFLALAVVICIQFITTCSLASITYSVSLICYYINKIFPTYAPLGGRVCLDHRYDLS